VREPDTLIRDYLDGRLDDEREREFWTRVRSESAFADQVAASALLESDLFEIASTWQNESKRADRDLRRALKASGHRESARPLPLTLLRKKDRIPFTTWLSAAALIGCIVLVGIFGYLLRGVDLANPNASPAPDRSDLPAVAILFEISDDAEFTFDGPGDHDNYLATGQPVHAGVVDIERGRLTFRFHCNAEVTIEGPAKFGLNAAKRAFLEHGELTAYCPDEAHGFTIGAPGVAVIDLGTRFWMSVDKLGFTHVVVREGKVQLTRDNGELVLLPRGSTARASRDPARQIAVDVPVFTVARTTGDLRVDDDRAVVGRDYGPGAVDLRSGSAELRLSSGVVIAARSPALLTLPSPTSAVLDHGEAEFDCPPDTRGFTVHLPGDVRVTDLGARFTIRLVEGNHGWVDVLKGRVELRGADGIAQGFTAGEIGEIDLASGAFVRHATDAANRIQPIVYWDFDTDFSATVGGSRFYAAPVNGPVIDPEGRIGGAVRFDHARDQYLRVTHPVLPDEAGKDHSYAAWYKLDRWDVDEEERFFVLETTSRATSTHAWTASYGLRDLGEGDVGQVFTSYTPRGEQDFLVPGAHADSQTPNLSDGWMHIAVVYDADGGSSRGNGRLTVFLNGEAVGGFDTTHPLAPTDGLIIGGHRDGTGRNFDGLIDEVAFWDCALTADQVQRVYRFGVRSLIPPALTPQPAHLTRDNSIPLNGERNR